MKDLDKLIKRFGGELGFKLYRGLPLSRKEQEFYQSVVEKGNS